jgi:DNA polymerase-2
MARLDPDFVYTEGGDSFLFPYLAYRAEANCCTDLLVLGRDPSRPIRKLRNDGSSSGDMSAGTSYFSYGRIHYRPISTQLFGRVHIDTLNSFILDEAGLQGLLEVARICRMPLHKASRASIGRCMSSLQFYHATTRNVLIPWKPTVVETFKTYKELLIADRGGMILEPKIGVHEKVAEFDFASLYPNIMSKMNLSGETVRCSCCRDSSKQKVPELGWNICEKRTGIVPLSLDILLKKRTYYKEKMKLPDIDPQIRQIYDARQQALKWILVTSFGYLGYSNSKFGRIDAHIATCAFDRKILLQAVRVAESHGFSVLHGIVDSLWVFKKNAIREDYLNLKDAIEKKTGFTISFEGVYKWIAFIHSKGNEQVPVPNRYFGVFEDDVDNNKGNNNSIIKIRGIEARRHDTPKFFVKCQYEILRLMATGNTVKEVKAMMITQVKEIFDRYAQMLKDRKVPINDLVFTKQTSKDFDDYVINNTSEMSSSLRQLQEEGKYLHAGEVLQYVITDYYNKHSSKRRTIPIELADKDNTVYDVQRYIELLAYTCNSITVPFGFQLSK